MADKDAPLRKLDEQLKRARQRELSGGSSEGNGGPGVSGLAVAFRVGVELVAGVAVGAGIGFLVDRWLGIKPWGLVIFFALGSAAGVLNVYRTMSRMKFPPAPQAPDRAAPDTDEDDENDDGSM